MCKYVNIAVTRISQCSNIGKSLHSDIARIRIFWCCGIHIIPILQTFKYSGMVNTQIWQQLTFPYIANVVNLKSLKYQSITSLHISEHDNIPKWWICKCPDNVIFAFLGCSEIPKLAYCVSPVLGHSNIPVIAHFEILIIAISHYPICQHCNIQEFPTSTFTHIPILQHANCSIPWTSQSPHIWTLQITEIRILEYCGHSNIQ